MLKAVQGIYQDGRIDLDEVPSDIERARVVVTFLDTDAAADHRPATPEARVLALRAWLDSLPPVASLPLSSLDRESIYE